MKIRTILGALVLLVPGVGFVGGAKAATIEFDYDPVTFELFGASNVFVDGSYYDVSFSNGKCTEWKNGCDPAKLAFKDFSSAGKASQALLDLVLIDKSPTLQWNSNHHLIYGLSIYGYGYVFTPYAATETPLKYYQRHVGLGTMPNIVSACQSCSLSDAANPYHTWADWTPASVSPVPIPATVWLFGTGILGLIGFSKRRKVA